MRAKPGNKGDGRQRAGILKCRDEARSQADGQRNRFQPECPRSRTFLSAGRLSQRCTDAWRTATARALASQRVYAVRRHTARTGGGRSAKPAAQPQFQELKRAAARRGRSARTVARAGQVWPPLPPPVTIRRNAPPVPARCLPCATQILPVPRVPLLVGMPARARASPRRVAARDVRAPAVPGTARAGVCKRLSSLPGRQQAQQQTRAAPENRVTRQSWPSRPLARGHAGQRSWSRRLPVMGSFVTCTASRITRGGVRRQAWPFSVRHAQDNRREGTGGARFDGHGSGQRGAGQPRVWLSDLHGQASRWRRGVQGGVSTWRRC
jgi:hypothetical protein